MSCGEKSEKVDMFGKQLSMHIAATNPLALDSGSIDKNILEKEVSLISEELKNIIQFFIVILHNQ